MKSLLGAAMTALAESDVTIKETEVSIHPDQAVQVAEVAGPEYPEGDPSTWSDEQRTQAWAAYVADNPEDADETDDSE
jgi:hypothetical protein